MPRTRACLIDIYRTALSCDFGAYGAELPRMVGVDVATWNRLFLALAPEVSVGRMSLADAFSAVVARSGIEPDPDVIDALVRRDRELLIESAVLYEDTKPFLCHLRERGIRTAFVSNCAENTGSLLDASGLSQFVDASVLSCDVGFMKPSPEIYLIALQRLGASSDEAVLIDDQQVYCDGAAALGIRTIRINRTTFPERDAVATLNQAADLI